MIAETLHFIFRDFPAVMLVLALLIAAVSKTRGSTLRAILVVGAASPNRSYVAARS
jgi:hypothetical protein